jgi:hypothetical protein
MDFALKHPATVDDLKEAKYPATFVGVEGPFPTKQGSVLNWWFRITTKKGIADVKGLTSTAFSTHPDCKAFRWAQAIDSGLTSVAGEWSDEGAKGNEVIIVVKYVPGRDQDFPGVEDVLPSDNPL